MTRRLLWAAAFALALGAAPAHADNPIFGWHTLQGHIDMRGAVADGTREWLDGGFGKTRYGSKDGTGADAEIAEVALVWNPQFTFDLSAHIHLQASPDVGRAVGPVEAFGIYKAPPAAVRLSGRAGLFFPPVSLEHDGPAWSLTRSLTPSAINSWIGEEVVVVGAEATAKTHWGDHLFELRGATFGYNDTSGTLLAFRGWALHDVKSMVGGRFRLPDSAARRMVVPLQAERTQPTREVDGRLGGYLKLRWSPMPELALEALGYDNNGNPTAIEDGQYGWDTRFANFGLVARPGETVEILAQGLFGETAMGPQGYGGMHLIDVRYASAYALVSYAHGENRLSIRGDWFETEDQGSGPYESGEDGWSVMAAWLRPFGEHLTLGTELLYVRSDRPSRWTDPGGLSEVQGQVAVRARF